MKPKPAPVSPSEVQEHVRAAIAAADERKAVELKVLDLEEISDFTDYFLVCSGTNERQVQAIADGVERALRQRGVRPLHVEGYRQARWILLDYGYLVVHVFETETRAFYGLERLWGDAEDVTEPLRA